MDTLNEPGDDLEDDLRPEYDRATLGKRVRGKYFQKAKPPRQEPVYFIYSCQNGEKAIILDRPPGPLSDRHYAFTFQGVRYHGGDVEWGIYRWSVDGTFVYGSKEPGWDLLLETRRRVNKLEELDKI